VLWSRIAPSERDTIPASRTANFTYKTKGTKRSANVFVVKGIDDRPLRMERAKRPAVDTMSTGIHRQTSQSGS
jgi:hypothetical protein